MMIAKNLRQLRIAKSITQEELAERIGVTGQAVSKWERDECCPDITLLPGLANFFGITVDKLIGMDEINDNTVQWNIAAKISDLCKEKKYREAAAYAEEKLKIYPDNYGLMYDIAINLALVGEVSERTIKLCELATEDPNDKRRGTAVAGLCFLYKMNNEHEKAANLALKRQHCQESRELLYPKFLDKIKRDEYLHKHLPRMLIDMYLMITDNDIASDMRSILVGEYDNHVPLAEAIDTIKEFFISVKD